MTEQSGSLKVNWKELSKVFKERYAYTTKIQITIQTLERMRQQPGESFRDYYTRWAAKEVLLKEKLSLPEMITKLLDGALPIFRKHMALDNFADYNEVCQKAEKIERMVETDPSQFAHAPTQFEPTFYRKSQEIVPPNPPAPAKAMSPIIQVVDQEVAAIQNSFSALPRADKHGISPWVHPLNALFVKARDVGLMTSLRPFEPCKPEDKDSFALTT